MVDRSEPRPEVCRVVNKRFKEGSITSERQRLGPLNGEGIKALLRRLVTTRLFSFGFI